MKKLLVLVLVVISLTSLVSCDCNNNSMEKGQVWVVNPSKQPFDKDSIMFLIMDIRIDKDNNKFVQVENITNGGVSVENLDKFKKWMDHKVCDKLTFEKTIYV